MQARFVKLAWENDAQTIASFYFEPSSRYTYEAGQYAVLDVAHAPTDGRGTSRTMTLSSTPADPLLRFTMRLSGHDSQSSRFKQALRELRPGDTVTIQDALGDLVLPLDASIPLVFVAGGIGIASYVGMVTWLLNNHEKRDIRLLYSVARTEDIVLQQPFDDYQAIYGLTKQLYTPTVNNVYIFHEDIIASRLTAADVCRQLRPDSLLYISGPEAMVDSLRREVATAGVSRQQIVFDYFEGYTSL